MRALFSKTRKVLTLAVLFLAAFANFASAFQTDGGPTLIEFIEKRLTKLPKVNGERPAFDNICPIGSDPIAARVFREYGALFAGDSSLLPPKCIFSGELELESYHRSLETKTAVIQGTPIALQRKAMEKLLEAVDDAEKSGRRISPLDGPIAGKRTFAVTLRIWNSRFFRALDHWVARQKITPRERSEAVASSLRQQISMVVEWESKGYFFSTDFSKSIFLSVAPPGTSQHLSMIAFDVVEADDPVVRAILNKHGWFQTIRTDEPHFTFLGVEEKELPRRGLRPLKRGSFTFWIPKLGTEPISE